MKTAKRQLVDRAKLFDVYERASRKLRTDIFSATTFDSIAEALKILEMQGMVQCKKNNIVIVVDAPTARAAIADTDLIASVNDIII